MAGSNHQKPKEIKEIKVNIIEQKIKKAQTKKKIQNKSRVKTEPKIKPKLKPKKTKQAPKIKKEIPLRIYHLSRLLVDVHQDSSSIMNDLLSNYQKELLEMLFMGDSDNRGKYNMIVAEHIEPFLPAEEYMDREDNENELKQVLGDLHAAYDIGEDGVLIVGRDGMIVAGANVNDYEARFDKIADKTKMAALKNLMPIELFNKDFR